MFQKRSPIEELTSENRSLLRQWILTSAVAGGDGGRQRLTAAMDEGGRWRLTVVMDGSCGSGGQ